MRPRLRCVRVEEEVGEERLQPRGRGTRNGPAVDGQAGIDREDGHGSPGRDRDSYHHRQAPFAWLTPHRLPDPARHQGSPPARSGPQVDHREETVRLLVAGEEMLPVAVVVEDHDHGVGGRDRQPLGLGAQAPQRSPEAGPLPLAPRRGAPPPEPGTGGPSGPPDCSWCPRGWSGAGSCRRPHRAGDPTALLPARRAPLRWRTGRPPPVRRPDRRRGGSAPRAPRLQAPCSSPPHSGRRRRHRPQCDRPRATRS